MTLSLPPFTRAERIIMIKLLPDELITKLNLL